MVSRQHNPQVLAYLNRDPLKHIVQLKMLSAYPGDIESFYLTSGSAAGVLLLLPTRVSAFDAATYPSTEYVVMIAADTPEVTGRALTQIPGNCGLIFKLINPRDRAVIERDYSLDHVASYFSYTCSDDLQFIHSSDIVVSDTLAMSLLPMFAENGYLRDELEYYFNSGSALTFSIAESDGPVSACFTYQNHADIWEIAGLYTRENARRKGYAKQVAASALNTLLSRGRVPRYQVLDTNLPSINLARSMGLTRFLVTQHFLSK